MPDFEIFPFTEDHLFQNLGNDLLGPDVIRNHVRAKYLSGYLQDLEAKTIIVEYEYTYGDYLDDFASYYVKCFHPYPRRCKRLHFFACPITRDKFLGLVRGDLQSTHLFGVRLI